MKTRQSVTGQTAKLTVPQEKLCSSETQTFVWMKLTTIIQQAVRITPSQSNKCCQHHEARKIH
jgi:hypothetical protein